ncbi:cysteine--tRNA ligase [bacterium DOLJORAL78_65_58]|nr:MAG: cysteine--tRNA ligase [bacterium DOLZORAL124_64_63]PIE75661.1 MAG: cysteine--tRNA ligase [bacterium DOLJORAL78_65_58]
MADRFTAEYHRDMAALNVLEPDVEPRVSGTIPEIIQLVEQLMDRGLAYAVQGDVYFRVREFGPYGQLSKRSVDEMLEGAGSRIDVDERKETPLDFALWKAAKPGEPSWDSPWGKGRPGWHIECSAMSSKHLGHSFDIHAGGRDLIFPHHENEIAQSQGAHGQHTYARTWVHNGFINFAGEKMSKSLGNFFTTRELTTLFPGETLRYFLMTVHYRSGLNFDLEVTCPECDAVLDKSQQEAARCGACGHASTAEILKSRVRFPSLEEADDRLAYIYGTLAAARRFLATAQAPAQPVAVEGEVGVMLAAFISHMANDLNSSGALGALSKPLAEVNSLLASGKGVSKPLRYATIEKFVQDMEPVAAILGCFGQDAETWLRERRDLKARRIKLDMARVEELLARRRAAREEKDWAAADGIRDELAAMGVSVQDGPEGSSWDFK